MLSLFGAFFGLVIGILVSGLLENTQLFGVLKEVLKNPSYLSLIIAFAIFGWVIGMSQWRKTQKISSTEEERKESNQFNSIKWEIVSFLVIVLVGTLILLIQSSAWLALGFIVFNEIIWIFWLLIRYDRMNCKWFRKSQPARSEDEKQKS